MWPIMFATSAAPEIAALPVFEKKIVDWIPVDVAGKAVVDVLTHEARLDEEDELGKYEVHNIVNPSRIPWSELVALLQKSDLTPTKMEEISMRDWIARLSKAGEDPKSAIPGLRLLGFFEGMVEEGDEESKVFETAKGRKVSGAMRECAPMCREWVDGNVAKWRRDGFLN